MSAQCRPGANTGARARRYSSERGSDAPHGATVQRAVAVTLEVGADYGWHAIGYAIP